ncbi:MAG: NAD(P)H-binding protein [Planctomycetia bacterium]|nr:NAD(P)H-binding protein [Planctomycetia bacterium]
MKIAITGAFGYTGKEIARILLNHNHAVLTLTNTIPQDPPDQNKMTVCPLNFQNPEELESSLYGCEILINTYWVRFNHQNFTFDQAIENTKVLFDAARRAGVRRIIHTSIANPSEDSPFEYYRGKAKIEKYLMESGTDYTILRPTVIFGANDILINNIAWTLRRFPVVGYFGDGQYHIRPIHIQDFARLAAHSIYEEENRILDAAGPEVYTYLGLLQTISKILSLRRIIIPVPISLGYAVARMVGSLHHDIFLTKEEIGALMADLLTSDAPACGQIHLSDWIRENINTIGRHYASELARRQKK